MKHLKFFLFLQLSSFYLCQASYAGTACWTWDTNTFYTYQFKTATYPGWGDTLYPYFNDSPTVYQGTYSNTPSCGQINPGQSAWTSNNTTCFVQIGGTTRQGTLGTLNLSNSSYTSCAPTTPVPLDSNLAFLIVAMGIFGTYVLRNKNERLA